MKMFILLGLLLVLYLILQPPCWGFHHASLLPNRHLLASQKTRLFAGKISSSQSPLEGLCVAVVGGGPSGLLLTHRLLQSGASQVSLFEGRTRLSRNLGSRAYAMGSGIRGRTAV